MEALRATFLSLILLATSKSGGAAELLVPAIITFGDSAVDIGNNDYIVTLFRANYPPYGRDFPRRNPTGRFCNGKLATDLTADTLGFTVYPPAYLSPEATGKNLITGANFASAASGYDDRTAALSHAVALSQQLVYYKEYQTKLANATGSAATSSSTLNNALYIISAGSSDFLQNYYVNPVLNRAYTPSQYSSFLVDIFSAFVKELHGLGARRVGATSLPPLGCLPATITLFGLAGDGCVSRINADAISFNKKLASAASKLQKQLPGLKLAVFDIYKPLHDLVHAPSKYGFSETRRGCCGTGTLETTSFLCNAGSIGTCTNASHYVFWDSVHPSEAANRVIADSILVQGISLVT